MKKIDIHCHVTPFPQYKIKRENGTRSLDAREQIAIHDKRNVDIGVLLPCVSPECLWSIGSNEATKYLVDQYPERFMWFCNVDPRQGRFSAKTDLSRILNHYKSLGAKGVGELTAQLYADDPLLDNFFCHCAACDMPVTIHIATRFGGCYGIVDELGLPRLERMLQKHENLKILGHSQPFWAEISADVTEETRSGYPKGKVAEGRLAQMMRKYENLYCDLSAGSGSRALMRDPEYAAKFIEEFSDRILYGCDICLTVNAGFAFEFDEFLTRMREDGMISEENYYKIVRGNAIKLLKLEEDK